MLEKYNSLIQFLLLHSYSLTRPGLLYGKSGISLCLFEASRFLKNEKLEEYGLELLQEAIAWNIKDYSFQNGKAGIAWVILYLIENEYIDADLQELYGDEIDEIIKYIRNCRKEQINIAECIGLLIFLFVIKKLITQSEFDEMCNILSSVLKEYLIELSNTSIGSELFYSYSSIFLGFSSIKEYRNDYLGQITELIIAKSDSVLLDNICCNLSYAANLFIYGKKQKIEKATYLGERALDIISDNIIGETLTFKQLVDFRFILEQLSDEGYNNELLWKICKSNESFLFNTEKNDNLFINSLKLDELMSIGTGIPRYIWLACLKAEEEKNFNKKILMLF